jgi:hypothetical protein
MPRPAPVRAIAACAGALLLAAGPASAAPASGTARPSAIAAPIRLTPLAAAPRLNAHRAAASVPQALTPGELHSAYALPDRGAPDQTIAVVSAFDDPSAAADLAAFDSHFDLPSCTTSDGCLRVINEEAQSLPLPAPALSGSQWITESVLGIDTAHAVCQSCHIVLVEADGADPVDFSRAVAAGGAVGATVVVTTFIIAEDQSVDDLAPWFSNPRTAIVSAAGDPEPGAQYGWIGQLNWPSSLPSVLSAGGTTLSLTTGGGYGGETAWTGTVSGCSKYDAAPAWQAKIAQADCGGERAGNDVSAVANPGLIVHISNAGPAGGPWYTAQGTSLAAPVLGGVIGLAGSMGSQEAPTLYARARSDPGAFHDILSGTDAVGCGSVLCQAGPGWDGPTGLGTPDGLAAYMPSGGALSASAPGLAIGAGPLRATRKWALRVRVSNRNAVAISGQLVLRRTLRVRRRLRLVRFASAKFAAGPLATATITIHFAGFGRSLLRERRALTAWAFVHARGPVGPTVFAQRQLRLRAP